MTCTWNPDKNDRNFKIHKIRFETAAVFISTDSNLDVEFDEEHSNDEERYRGAFRWNDNYLFTVHTMRNGTVRIISARPATKREIERYYRRETNYEN